MDKTPITVHMMVKNEDRFIWYAINSILPYVDKILITDTGSGDRTLEIIQTIKSNKVTVNSVKINHIEEISKIRNDQITETETDWFWVVDGDEIYPKSLCEEIIEMIGKNGKLYEGIVVGRYDLIGDVYHHQEESVGAYNLFGRNGHIVLRLINKSKISGLHVKGKYPYEGYYDKDEIEITYHDESKFGFTKGKLFHAMYLPRSTRGAVLSDTYHRNKWKIEKGFPNQKNIPSPEVFFIPKPEVVPDITGKRSIYYEMVSSLITPIKKIKRRFIH